MNKKIFIVAEIGSVHDGSFGNACNLIKIAKECGADAIKFQTHLPEYETLKMHQILLTLILKIGLIIFKELDFHFNNTNF